MLPSYTGLLARAGELRPMESITADIDALPAEAEAERTPLYFEVRGSRWVLFPIQSEC
jgi:hypothetical protein